MVRDGAREKFPRSGSTTRYKDIFMFDPAGCNRYVPRIRRARGCLPTQPESYRTIQETLRGQRPRYRARRLCDQTHLAGRARKRDVKVKSDADRVDLGGRRIRNKTKNTRLQ